MTIYEEALQLTSQLTLVEKARLMEYLSGLLKHDLEVEGEVLDEMGYPIGYFDETYGCMADDPIERNQPLHPDVWDEMEAML